MKKILTIFCMFSMAVASVSCDKDHDSNAGNSVNDVVFVPKDLNTKSYMESMLVNRWENGDNIGVFSTYLSTNGSVSDNGKANAKFVVRGAPAAVNITQAPGPLTQKVSWRDYKNKHSFYIYSPYSAQVTKRDVVPFTISSNQIQDDENIWRNTNPYNFQWDVLLDIIGLSYGISSNVVRFELKRMLPVCEFVITKQDATVNDYCLESITLAQDESVTTKLLKQGAINVNLDEVSNYSNASTVFAALTPVDSYVLSSPAKTIDMATLKEGEGFSMFMSVNPVTGLGKHNVIATFVNKNDPNDKQSYKITREDANYSIENGVGNITRYYFSIGQTPSTIGGDTTIKLGVGINPHVGGGDINLVWN